MGITHHPFVYQIGPLEVGGFGIAMLMGFVIAQITTQRELARRGHDPTPMGDLVIAAVIGGLLGAKLYYAIATQDLSTVFSRAGFTYWGGLIGGILAVLLVIGIKRLSVPQIADVCAPAIAAAYAVGRTGCWAVGDDYGLPWNSRFAVMFPEGAPPSTVANLSQMFGISFPPGTDPNQVVAVHPTQLYHTGAAFTMFLILWLLRDHRHAQGWLFGVFCVLAGLERFLIEFVRAKDDRFLGDFTGAQLIAALFILVGVVIMVLRWNVTPRSPGIHAKASRAAA
jgi:phosphatidylglycerol---prolipoprotein diacylglyceryl transferase